MREISACHPDVWHPDPHTDPAEKMYDEWKVHDDAYKVYNDATYKDPKYSSGVRPCKRSPMGPVPVAQPVASTDCDKRRSARRLGFHERLVRSAYDEHSAVALCEDIATRGPDFFSEKEQKLCHMETHQLYDACNDDIGVNTKCFDTVEHKIRFEGQLETRDDTPEYVTMDTWGYT